MMLAYTTISKNNELVVKKYEHVFVVLLTAYKHKLILTLKLYTLL